MKPTTPPQQAPHRWRMAGACVASAMRLVPRKRRFDAALLLARAAVPVARLTPQFRLLDKAGLDSGMEIALHLLIHAMTMNDTLFEPRITIDGYDRFVAAMGEGRGVLLAAPHAALGLVMIRPFHDDGIAPIIVSPDPNLRFPGTSVTVETLQRSATSLVQARSRLRDGRVVGAMLDRAEHEPRDRTKEFDTALGRVIFAPALLHVAARCGAHVAFSEGHLEEGEVRVRIVIATSTTGEELEQEFIDFVRATMSKKAAARPIARLERASTT